MPKRVADHFLGHSSAQHFDCACVAEDMRTALAGRLDSGISMGMAGILQVDGYAAYNRLACAAHS